MNKVIVIYEYSSYELYSLYFSKGGDNMNKIKMYREKKGMFQWELAKLMNVNASTVAKWESPNNILPRSNKLPLLAKVFGCKIDDLFGEDDTDVGGKEEGLCFMEKMR